MGLQVEIWEGTEAIRGAEASWDDLWSRTPGAPPTSRARMLTLHLGRLFPRDRLRALVVQSRGRLILAMPLRSHRRLGGLPCQSLAYSSWGLFPAVLVDTANVPVDALADAVAEGLSQLDGKALFLDGLPSEAPLWDKVQAALVKRGYFACREPRETLAWLPVGRFRGDGWSSESRSHRKRLRRAYRRLAAEGTVALRVVTPVCPGAGDWPRWLDESLRIEDYKSDRNGRTSIRQAGLEDLYVRAAATAIAHREWLLAFLEVAGRPVAFEFGYLARGAYYSVKVGYDPAWAEAEPGHVLIARLGRYLAERQDVDRIEWYCDAGLPLARRWRARGRPTDRLWAARPAWLGRALAWCRDGRRLVTGQNRPSALSAAQS